MLLQVILQLFTAVIPNAFHQQAMHMESFGKAAVFCEVFLEQGQFIPGEFTFQVAVKQVVM